MKKVLFLCIIFSILLTGCHVVSDVEGIMSKQSAPKIIPGVAVITGTLASAEGSSLPQMPVHFAQVFRQDGKAAFLYDTGSSPSVITDKQGFFEIGEVTAGEYLLIIGDPMTDYKFYQDNTGEPIVIIAQGGETVDLGTIEVNY